MFESGRFDLDRMAQERLDPDLILGVDFGLDGSDLTGRGAAALTPELELPRWRAAGSFPALADLAIPSWVRPGIWPWSMPVARVVHQEHWLGSGRLEAWSSATMAALGSEVSPEQAVRGSPGGYGLQKAAQRGGRRF